VSRWPRPARPRAPIAVAVGVVAIWWFVAHSGGAGWVQFVGDLVFGSLLVGIVGPAVVTGRVKLEVQAAPHDGEAGLPLGLQVAASSRVRIRPVDPPGPEAFVGPAVGRNDREVTLIAPRRGVFATLTVDVASAAPFALQWWTRRVTLSLPHELHVAPRRGRPDEIRPRRDARVGDVVMARPNAHSGLPRGARPYVPGDARRNVHWRATAHTGELMVKELERPSGEPVTVVVDLPPDPDDAERSAGRALGTVVELLHNDEAVRLQTHEPSGPVTGLVTDRRQAGRRLARAVSRPGTVRPSPGTS
jgi:uncharacterized protein (DUF58 family)